MPKVAMYEGKVLLTQELFYPLALGSSEYSLIHESMFPRALFPCT